MNALGQPLPSRCLSCLRRRHHRTCWCCVLFAVASLIGLGRTPAAATLIGRPPAAASGVDVALALLGRDLRLADVAAAANSGHAHDAGGVGVLSDEEYDSREHGASQSTLAEANGGRRHTESGGAAAPWRQRLFGSYERVEHADWTEHGAIKGFFGYSSGSAAAARLRKGHGCTPLAGEPMATACRLVSGGGGGGVDGAHSGAAKELDRAAAAEAALATRRPTLDLKRWNNAVMRLWGKRGGRIASADAAIRETYNVESRATPTR